MNRHAENSDIVPLSSRRQFIQQAGMGLGSLALASMLHEHSRGHEPALAREPHFPAKVRSAIWLYMSGGVSQVDTFDYKPELQRRHGEPLPGAVRRTGVGDTSGRCLRSPFRFHQHGRSGTWVSELFPLTARHVDDMAFLHSCYTHQPNHAPSAIELMTGMDRPGFPCLGSWLSYGLGSLNENLPSFVVMYGERKPIGDGTIWGPGFLPKSHQPLVLEARNREEIPDLARVQGVGAIQQRSQLDILRQLNQQHQDQHPMESDLAARIQSFELAYRMQMAAPEAMDINQESENVREMYGLNYRLTENFGRQCLRARRLVERGVRFVQVFFSTPTYAAAFDGPAPWDAHGDIRRNHTDCAVSMDQPVSALLTDLKSRGLLESTLVIWGGEFGRTSDSQGNTGRDHNPWANTLWMAGGGIRGGVHYGATDDFGYRAVHNRVSVHDLGATIFHLFGMDHERLTYRFNGRDFRFTDVAGNVIHDIMS